MIPKERLILGGLVLVQFWLLSGLTTFIAPEFSLYPYFVEHGLLPFRQIIDQHFPLIFFGPLHLGQFGLNDPSRLQLLYLGLVTIINLEFWTLIGKKIKNLNHRAWLQLGLIISLCLLGINHLWLETFALAFILIGLHLSHISTKFSCFLAGMLWSAAVIVRPLLIPFIILIWWRDREKYLTLGGVTVGVIVAWWLIDQELVAGFIELLHFNREYYAPLAGKLPSRSETLQLSWVVIWLLTLVNSKTNVLLLGTAALLPLYPRFELFHGLVMSAIPSLPAIKLKLRGLSKAWLIVGLVLVLRNVSRQPNVNFYNQESLQQQAGMIRSFKPTLVYFFGGPDQLYYLTNTLPPGGYYLPSLPWYHAKAEFVETQIKQLETYPSALVVVNHTQVDGQDLLDYSQRLYLYIRQNYQLIETAYGLEIYQKINPLAKK